MFIGCSINSAFAHVNNDTLSSGFFSGLTHPIFGWDHMAAMIAVGLWGAILKKPAIWMLPIAFPAVMSLGAAAGILQIPIAYTEAGIALSCLVLGILVTSFVKAPIGIAVFIVALFAVFHGYAHGIELPEAVNPMAYAVGFVVGTGLLHLVGILLGFLTEFELGKTVIRLSGIGIALIGAYFLFAIQ
ncbi:MAG: HupE/UreJ family protein [Pseudomonadota bacterium]